MKPPPLPSVGDRSSARWLRTAKPVAGLAARLLAAFLLGYSFHACSEKYGVNVASARWMPKGASHGAFYHSFTLIIIGPPRYLYEYDISEEDFAAYLKTFGKKPKDIVDPVYVRRYLAGFIRAEDYVKDGQVDGLRYAAATGVTITNGLVWQHSFEDTSSTYAFDRDRSRAFIEINTR
jgi:hypothetical protein